MIPDEAVEAAARSFPGYTPEHEADDFEREINETCRSTARRILEAGAPHLMAAAWERGQADLTHDLFRDQNLRRKGGGLRSEDATHNPYRNATNGN